MNSGQLKITYFLAKCFSIISKIIGAATLPPPPPECSAKATTKISGYPQVHKRQTKHDFL